MPAADGGGHEGCAIPLATASGWQALSRLSRGRGDRREWSPLDLGPDSSGRRRPGLSRGRGRRGTVRENCGDRREWSPLELGLGSAPSSRDGRARRVSRRSRVCRVAADGEKPTAKRGRSETKATPRGPGEEHGGRDAPHNVTTLVPPMRRAADVSLEAKRVKPQ